MIKPNTVMIFELSHEDFFLSLDETLPSIFLYRRLFCSAGSDTFRSKRTIFAALNFPASSTIINFRFSPILGGTFLLGKSLMWKNKSFDSFYLNKTKTTIFMIAFDFPLLKHNALLSLIFLIIVIKKKLKSLFSILILDLSRIYKFYLSTNVGNWTAGKK